MLSCLCSLHENYSWLNYAEWTEMVYTVLLLNAHSLSLKHFLTDRGYDFIEVLRWFAERVDRWNYYFKIFQHKMILLGGYQPCIQISQLLHDFQDSLTVWRTQTGHIRRVPAVYRGRIYYSKYGMMDHLWLCRVSMGMMTRSGLFWTRLIWWTIRSEQYLGDRLKSTFLSSGVDAGIWSSHVELGKGW